MSVGATPTHFLGGGHGGSHCWRHQCPQGLRAQGAAPEPRSPEEEAQGAHVSQVHTEHAADLLQGPRPLRLVPARGLQEAVAVGEAQGGVHAGGGAGEQGV